MCRYKLSFCGALRRQTKPSLIVCAKSVINMSRHQGLGRSRVYHWNEWTRPVSNLPVYVCISSRQTRQISDIKTVKEPVRRAQHMRSGWPWCLRNMFVKPLTDCLCFVFVCMFFFLQKYSNIDARFYSMIKSIMVVERKWLFRHV